jgi:hypothetical protein
MSVKTETCENCGATIGALETPYLWQESTVCVECYERLSRRAPAATETVSPPTPRTERFDTDVRPSTWSPMKAALLEQSRGERSDSNNATLARRIAAFGALLVIAGYIGTFTTTSYLTNAFLVMIVAGGILVGMVILFVPVIVAEGRRHSNMSAIRALTVLSILIPILWIVALVWAYSAPDPYA